MSKFNDLPMRNGIVADRFVRSLKILALTLFATLHAFAQQPSSPFVHEDPDASPLAAAWALLEVPNAVLRAPGASLTLSLTNLQQAAVMPALDIRISRDGQTIHKRVVLDRIGGFERRPVQVDFTPAELGLSGLQYSGVIYTAVAVNDTNGRPLPHAEVLPVYYHPEGTSLLFYRRQALIDRFGAGDFRGGVTVAAATNTARMALQQAGLKAVPQLSRISPATTTFAAATATGGTKRYCLLITSDTFYDSSGRVWISPQGNSLSMNYGEDYGINGSPLPMSRAYVSLSQTGTQIWAGHLDQFGCTPYIPASSSRSTSIYYLPWYSKSGVNITAFMTDAGIGSAIPSFQMEVPASNSPLLISWMDPDEYAHSIFAAAAAAVERYPGGRTNVLYEYRLREEGDNNGTVTSYSPSGHPLITIKYSTAAKSKFTLGHEYGHAIWMTNVNPPITPADVDYSVSAGEGNQHTWTSKEWQLIAAIEGFAHFVSAAIWNNVTPNADCKVVLGSNINPFSQSTKNLNQFDRLFENSYNPASYPHQGIEQDWAQFFWNYRTDAIALPGAPPTDAQLVNLFVITYPWPIHNGFFADFSGGVPFVIPSPPAVPFAATQRFLVFADLAGVNH